MKTYGHKLVRAISKRAHEQYIIVSNHRTPICINLIGYSIICINKIYAIGYGRIKISKMF